MTNLPRIILSLMILSLLVFSLVIAQNTNDSNLTQPSSDSNSQPTGAATTEPATPPPAPLTPLQITIQVAPATGSIPLFTIFNVTSNLPISSYVWDFNGDGKTDSTSANPDYVYSTDGIYSIKVTVTTADNQTASATTQVIAKTAMTATILANPLSGSAPLIVQYTVAATGKEPFKYTWDFNNDGSIDSTKQNPGFTYEDVGEYNATLQITDATGNTLQKIIPITVSNFDSKLKLDSYFPKTLDSGDNQIITLIIINGGQNTVKDISAKIIGTGITTLSSSSISSLSSGDQDSLVIKVNIAGTDSIDAKVKIKDKTFPLNITITKQTQYSKDELLTQLTNLKENIQQQETTYYEKKSEGYLVSEIYDSIKESKKKIESAQQQILTNKFADAKITLDLVKSSLDDTNKSLANSKQEEQSFLQWLGGNIGVIAAIITGLAAIGTGLKFVFDHFKKASEKVSEKVKEKIATKKDTSADLKAPSEHHTKSEEKKEEAPHHSHSESKETDSESKPDKSEAKPEAKKEHTSEAKKHKK